MVRKTSQVAIHTQIADPVEGFLTTGLVTITVGIERQNLLDDMAAHPFMRQPCAHCSVKVLVTISD